MVIIFHDPFDQTSSLLEWSFESGVGREDDNSQQQAIEQAEHGGAALIRILLGASKERFIT